MQRFSKLAAGLSMLVVAIVLATTAASCPPKVADPSIRAATYALTTVQRLGEIQGACIQANQTGALTDHGAIVCVQFTVAAVKVVQAAPNGWLPAVQAGEASVKTALGTLTPTLAATFAVLDTVLAYVGAGGAPPPVVTSSPVARLIAPPTPSTPFIGAAA
jgi:hypothetical protein